MKYYKSFVLSSQNPFNEYETMQQEFLNDSFDNASSFYQDIYEEIDFGTLQFKRINARINKIIDSKDGTRVNDDYRKIIFPTLEYKPPLGTRYKFEDNIWIVFSTDNIKSLDSSVYVRRCNQVIYSQDKYGNIHEEPVVLDIKPTKSSVQEYEEISIPIQRQILEYQLNDWTKNIDINSRLMFASKVYKVGTIMSFNRMKTFDKESIHFSRVYMDNDLINEYDNIELQIPDFKEYVYTSEEEEYSIENISTGILNIPLYVNNIPLESEEIIYELQSSTPQDSFVLNKDKTYSITSNFSKAIIKVKCKYNLEAEVFVTVSRYTDMFEIIPNTDYISLNQQIDYKVINHGIPELFIGLSVDYKGKHWEIPCDEEYKLIPQTIKTQNFIIETNNDNITKVTNLLTDTDNLLKITWSNIIGEEGNKIKYIELGGLF